MRYILIPILIFFISFISFAQTYQEKLVQFSGLIVTSDSSLPVPNVHLRIKNTMRGTFSSNEGFFSFVVKELDTIVVTSVGFQTRYIFIPSNLSSKSITMIIPMFDDTLVFAETVIFPWPSKERFKQAFLEIEPDITYTERAKENLNQEKLLAISEGLPKDGREQQHLYMQGMAKSAGYLGGQTNYAIFPGSNIPVPLSLMNPWAWAELIKAIKEGKFKKE